MKELFEIQSRLKAPKSQYNSFGKYKYRSCEDILQASKSLLKEYGCALTMCDDVVPVGSRIYVKATARLVNSSGEFVETTAFAREDEVKKGMDGAQITGAASSYARKYALNGLFAIDDTKDADATNDGTQEAEADPYTAIAIARTKEELTRIYNHYKAMQRQEPFLNALSTKRKELGV